MTDDSIEEVEERVSLRDRVREYLDSHREEIRSRDIARWIITTYPDEVEEWLADWTETLVTQYATQYMKWKRAAERDAARDRDLVAGISRNVFSNRYSLLNSVRIELGEMTRAHVLEVLGIRHATIAAHQKEAERLERLARAMPDGKKVKEVFSEDQVYDILYGDDKNNDSDDSEGEDR